MLARLALVLTVEVAGFVEVAGEDREDTKSPGHWNPCTFGKKPSEGSQV